MSYISDKRGFTLIELLAAVAILSILLVMGITSYSRIVKSSKEEIDKSNLKMLKNTSIIYLQSNKNRAPKDFGSYSDIMANELLEK